jgi:hypothetical protein
MILTTFKLILMQLEPYRMFYTQSYWTIKASRIVKLTAMLINLDPTLILEHKN